MFNTLEERGELNVPRDVSGNPEDVQVVALEQIPSEEEVYAPNVSLGPPPTPPAQYADFVILRPLQYRIAETLIEMWEEGQRRIKSEDVYERVSSTGQEVPDGLMNAVLSTFEEDGVIRVQGFLGREAIKRHGAKVTTWVETDRALWRERTRLRLDW